MTTLITTAIDFETQLQLERPINQSATHIFFYGTLRAQLAHPVYRRVKNFLRYISVAQCNGQLYDLGAYPGLCVTSKSDAIVFGDLYQVLSAAKTLPVLDEYEGCAEHQSRPHEYRRIVQPVASHSGVQHSAWVYIYQGETKPRQQILSGDYVYHLQHNTSACS